MAFASLVEVKLADLRRCDKDGCNRWWHKTDFKLIGNDSHNIFLKCPHCRGARTNPTKYWHGPPSGPREPAYDYPAKMPQTPQMHPPPPNSSGDRRSSAKRQFSGDSRAATPTQNKKPKSQQVCVERNSFRSMDSMVNKWLGNSGSDTNHKCRRNRQHGAQRQPGKHSGSGCCKGRT